MNTNPLVNNGQISNNIYCFAIFGYLPNFKILAFYSPTNLMNLNMYKTIFLNGDLQIKQDDIVHITVESNKFNISLLGKSKQIVFSMITKQDYPKRLVGECLEELELNFNSRINQISYSIKELELNEQFLNTLKKLYEKYNNPEFVDSLSQISSKINQIKDKKDKDKNDESICKSYGDIEKLETIKLSTEDLEQSAGLFRLSVDKLKNKILWKNIKTVLILLSIVLLIIGIVLIAIILST